MIKKIVVGAYVLEVIYDEGMRDGPNLGEFRPFSQKIALCPGLSGPLLREVLAHEVEHAISWVAGFRDNEEKFTEEQYVTRITPLRLDTYDRNPALKRHVFGE